MHMAHVRINGLKRFSLSVVCFACRLKHTKLKIYKKTKSTVVIYSRVFFVMLKVEVPEKVSMVLILLLLS